MTRRGPTPTPRLPAGDSLPGKDSPSSRLRSAVRLIHVWQIRKAPFFGVLMGDARAYDEWARRIAGGDWLGHEVFYQAPLYPYFLGLLYATAGRDLLMVRICQAILGSIACVWLGLAGRRFFSRRAGLIAGLLLALYAPAIFFDALVQKSVLDVFFICLTIWIVSGLAMGEARRRWPWLWLGLGMGALSLTRENALVFAAVILCGSPSASRGRRGACRGRGRLSPRADARAPAGCRTEPHRRWRRILRHDVAVRTQFLYRQQRRRRWDLLPLRFGRGAPEYERQDAIELAEHAAGRHLTPAEVSRYWEDRALDFITSQPAAWLRLLGRKLALLVERGGDARHREPGELRRMVAAVRLAARVGHFGILVPLAAFGRGHLAAANVCGSLCDDAGVRGERGDVLRVGALPLSARAVAGAVRRGGSASVPRFVRANRSARSALRWCRSWRRHLSRTGRSCPGI